MNPATEVRRDEVLEHIESRVATPRETADVMLREGNRQVTDLRGSLAALRNELANDPLALQELTQMEAGLESAWEQLNTDIEKAVAREVLETPKESLRESEEPPEERVASELKNAFEGTGDMKTLTALLEYPAALEAADWTYRDHMDQILKDSALNETSLEISLHIAELRPELRQAAVEMLADQVGPVYAERVLNDAAFRASLAELNASLEGRSGKNGPPMCTDRSLRNLVAIHELTGLHTRELLEAIDLSSYASELESKDQTVGALQVIDARFRDDGTFEGELSLFLEYAKNGEIERRVIRELRRNEQGEAVPYTKVEHTIFKLPDSLKSGGIAARVTEKSLAAYDRTGIDAITLHADIDIGGYAWASYGYGWDDDEMVRTHLSRSENPIMQNGVEVLEFEELLPSTKTEVFAAAIQGMARDVKERVQGAIDDLPEKAKKDEAIQALLKAYDAAIEHPHAVTPQTLAAIGADGPKFFRGASGRWYLEDDFAAAKASGAEKGEYAGLKGPLHAGKIGLIHSDWYGKIDLKKDGPQKGKNRELLEGTFKRRSS